MNACSRQTCFAPESSCDLGHLNRAACPSWKGRDEVESIPDEGVTNELLFPWSGSALGLVDVGFVAGRAKPLVVGIAGPQNAGKSTLLAAWYLLIGQGHATAGERSFAGSYSLAGWEAVASALRWAPGQQPGFPPHTTSRGGRAPGLLHLAFRSTAVHKRDYLFTDAPGEWFQKWAVNRDAPDGEGARWISEHADALLLIADRESLSGTNMGSARGSLQLLAQRIAAERGARPLALVWTKSDVAISPEMEASIRGTVLGLMPDAVEFSVSILAGEDKTTGTGQGLIELLDWTLSVRRGRISLPPVRATNSDPLFLFGARK
ncbi:TRAFAC clade GTPase domain-containing protein [Luteimonas suaedae]|uniref:TRAFAC clade GTPase domain-containing protein n=1 Tax=Luteimonas suaedae TaxID=2605430 RepID=UPI0011EF0DE5|nr:hypothetical protein [Luteimonas suaedae]